MLNGIESLRQCSSVVTSYGSPVEIINLSLNYQFVNIVNTICHYIIMLFSCMYVNVCM